MNFKYDMKVIRHAGVDSRMIILDDQARQQMTRHFLIVTSMQRFAHHGLHCMPDEARDGQNVALKWQLRSDESFVGVLDRPK